MGHGSSVQDRREARRANHQQQYNPRDFCNDTQAISPQAVQAEILRSAQQQPASVAPHNSPASSIPFTASPEQKLGVTHTTREGLVLSRGQNGELHATIANKENSLGIGYVRKNGAYSTETSFTRIYDSQPGVKSQLMSIKQDGTYSLKVDHHGGGSTTLVVDMDRSLAAMKIQTGNNVYLLRESDIRELDQKTAEAAVKQQSPVMKESAVSSAPITPPEVKTSSGSPSIIGALPGAYAKVSEFVKGKEPVIRKSLTDAFKAVEDAAKRTELAKLNAAKAAESKAAIEMKAAEPKAALESKATEPKAALESKTAETKPGIEVKASETPKLNAPKETTSTSTEPALEAKKLTATPEQVKPAPEIEASPSDKKAATETTKQVESKPVEPAQSAESAKAPEAAKSTEAKPSPIEAAPSYDPIQRAKEFFAKNRDTYRKWVSDGKADTIDAAARRTVAEKYGKEAGMTPEQIKATLDGKPSSTTSSPAQSAKPTTTNTATSPTTGQQTLTPSEARATTSSALTTNVMPEPPTMRAPVDTNARLAEGLKRFNENVKVSEWARNNPFKAMTYAASLSEAVTGAMKAKYGPDDRHSPVPGLLKLLNTDVAKGFEFTTQQGGIGASVAAEAFKGAGDTTIAFGAFAAADRGLMSAASTRVGTALGGRAAATVAGRTLGVVGVAYHGYSTFSDGSFVNQNNLQLAGSTTSPVVMGAIMGSPLGPVGAAGGAVVGAGSEAVGVAVGYGRLQGQIDTDWKKREVREALALAEQGFVLPSDDVRVTNRKPLESLPTEHQEVLTDVTRLATLGRLTRELPAADLKALGFKAEPKQSATPEERNAIGAHNWDRMVQLTEGRSRLNPYRLWAGDYLDEVRREHPGLANTFSAVFNDAKEHYVNVYNHAPHVTYRVTENKATEESELLTYIHQVAHSIPADSAPLATLEQLQKAFPGIEAIMQRPGAREKLINNLEAFSENTGRFRRLLDLESLGR